MKEKSNVKEVIRGSIFQPRALSALMKLSDERLWLLKLELTKNMENKIKKH